MTTRKHYHVISGDHGYMPDRNEIYRTKGEARADMLWWKQQIENEMWQVEEYNGGRVFDGSAREGYYEARYPTSIVGLEYIELTECDCEDCLEELDEEE